MQSDNTKTLLKISRSEFTENLAMLIQRADNLIGDIQDGDQNFADASAHAITWDTQVANYLLHAFSSNEFRAEFSRTDSSADFKASCVCEKDLIKKLQTKILYLRSLIRDAKILPYSKELERKLKAGKKSIPLAKKTARNA